MADYEGAGIILTSEDGYVLIVKDIKTGKWSFPKGTKEECDDSPVITAVRECSEEIGLNINRDYQLLAEPPFISFNRYYYHANINRGAERRIVIQDEEITDYRWMNPNKSCAYWRELNVGVRQYMKTACTS
jgi:8-oxo-dGTP pyrophosphatase MutT (NUDIX family)